MADDEAPDGIRFGGKVYMMYRGPTLRWRRRIPVWRPKSWLGMAVRNRLHEWHWFVSFNLHKWARRDFTWPPHTIFVPVERPNDDNAE